ncbi:hypothetical protein P691DRAFT_841061, partial [Macrolepiota fuliginosa MF-IS2]
IVAALDLNGQIIWNDVCPGATTLGHAKVVLDNGRLSGGVMGDGGFTIPNVPTGAYLLSVISHDHSFDHLRVDVTNETVNAYPYTLGTPFNPPSTVSLPYPLKLTPKEKLDFFVPPQSFNLYSLLTNPMVLFAVGGLVLFAVNSLVDVQALQEAAKQVDERWVPSCSYPMNCITTVSSPTRMRGITDGHDQARSGPVKRGTKRSRR